MARIVVLANSRKDAGHCIAGVDIVDGIWLRPISGTLNGELSTAQCQVQLAEGTSREVGDVVDVDLGEPRPTAWHPEDVRLKGGLHLHSSWSNEQIAELLAEFIEIDEPLLGSQGDRLSVDEINRRPDHSSLQLVRTSGLRLFWTTSMRGNLQLRGSLSIRNVPVSLSVTDLAVCEQLKGEPPVTIAEALLTISLATPFIPVNAAERYCFKVIAAVLPLQA
jgi:hypothetical protein